MKKGYRFKGWDFSELAECFEINVPEDSIDEGVLLIQEYLEKHLEFGSSKLKENAKVMRRFLKKLIKEDHSYITSVWAGIVEVEDDFSLIQISIPLIGYMWD